MCVCVVFIDECQETAVTTVRRPAFISSYAKKRKKNSAGKVKAMARLFPTLPRLDMKDFKMCHF